MNKLPIAAATILSIFGPMTATAQSIERGPVFEGEVSNWRYPPGIRTRGEVVAEARDAMRHGALHSGEVMVWLDPPSTLSRVQVAAEAREAARLGLLTDMDGTRYPTPVELDRIQMAGEQAVEAEASASKR